MPERGVLSRVSLTIKSPPAKKIFIFVNFVNFNLHIDFFLL